ncbi:hypothetical protein HBH56_063690 [Parastagonospora nodorum]|uniref:Uncharacterized protein n=1 Tax=Phaeosphaeria nodorum (strain SN15 / ATCC MYA-4574 / FGSC 10173) TaxID=321614 RepID=A0A7U2ESH6_PHANO|nr:hypothetical protein HBH56_063690 [Parastagonospora nodorum]QRC92169.1 hypothetical protein JI435_402050 [Parastagonospora nodorum SN15]KAH3930619.1 hypothetical protein HBH54_107630 [Parastagonospora nodorum]KAH3954024.1 hypothetical protein HBH53_022720 [Parastagonospora nodorum]KAH4010072.1 hypothetical protein HBI13_213670 [Parastagonospora nodorum]
MIDNRRLTILELQTGGQSINAPDIKISQSQSTNSASHSTNTNRQQALPNLCIHFLVSGTKGTTPTPR